MIGIRSFGPWRSVNVLSGSRASLSPKRSSWRLAAASRAAAGGRAGRRAVPEGGHLSHGYGDSTGDATSVVFFSARFTIQRRICKRPFVEVARPQPAATGCDAIGRQGRGPHDVFGALRQGWIEIQGRKRLDSPDLRYARTRGPRSSRGPDILGNVARTPIRRRIRRKPLPRLSACCRNCRNTSHDRPSQG